MPTATAGVALGTWCWRSGPTSSCLRRSSTPPWSGAWPRSWPRPRPRGWGGSCSPATWSWRRRGAGRRRASRSRPSWPDSWRPWPSGSEPGPRPGPSPAAREPAPSGAGRSRRPSRERRVGAGLRTATHGAGAGAGRRWWILAAALTVQSTISLIGQGLPALVPFVKTDLDLNHAQAGVFATITGLGTFLALFAVGWAVDRAGDRAVLVGGGVLTGLLTVAAAFAPGYPLLLLLLVLVGIGVATPTPAGSTAVMREFPIRQRGVVMSVRQTGIPLGGAVAAVTLAPLAALWGWRTALIAGGVAALAGALAGHLCYVR